MKRLLMLIAAAFFIHSKDALAAGSASYTLPDGMWTCTHTEPGYSTTRILQFVGGRLIETGGLGRKHLVQDAAISQKLVAWNDSPSQEFEFDLVGAKLTERDADLGTTMIYNCQKN